MPKPTVSSRPFRVPRNQRNRMGGFAFLGTLIDGEAALAIFDPQYRGIMDHLQFGNEGARQKGRAALPQMTDFDICGFIEQIERALRPSGHLMLWCDKFSIGSGRHIRYFARAPKLQIVDLIHWNKLRPGMGRRARCCSEYLVIAQKLPIGAKGHWTDHSILDGWAESADPATHVHAKPYQLTERLIRATTKRGDLVIDPAAGGYGVLTACRRTGRDFAGCDILTSEKE